MKILVHGVNFAPEPVGIGKYTGEMAEWLAAQGHDVRVVCAPPYYPAWRLDAAYRWPPYRRERWHGVDVWRAPLWVPVRPGGLARVLHLVTFALASLPVMIRHLPWRPDVVMTVAPALACAPAGWLTARLAGARAWLHVQDFEVDVALRLGLLRGRVVGRALRAVESWLLRRFDVVSTISRRMREHLVRKGVPAERTHLFVNWVDVHRIVPLQGTSPYRRELDLPPDVHVVLFSGTLGAKQGLATIPDAAQRLRHRSDILFLVCGDGAMRDDLARAASTLPNLRLLPLQPAERLSDLLGLASVHLLTQSPEAEDLVLPSKLTGMLASGRPVVATCRADTELADVVTRCGYAVPPGDAEAVARAVATLVDDAALRADLGSRARDYAVSHLARDTALGSLVARMRPVSPAAGAES